MKCFREKRLTVLAGSRFIDIAYKDWGDENNSNVAICVHGLSRNMNDFDDLAVNLSKTWRVIAVDMPGRGQSDWLDNKQAYTYELYEVVCAHVIALAKVEKVAWIGTSMGGVLGIRLAANGAPFAKLVLNDIGPFIPAEGRKHNQANFGSDPIFKTESEAIAYIKQTRSTFGPFTEAGWLKFGRDSLRQLNDGSWTLHYDPGLASKAPITDSDMWELWPKVRMPVLTIWGEDSRLLTAPTVDRMAHSGPRTEVFSLPGVGHCPGLTSLPEISAIANFIER